MLLNNFNGLDYEFTPTNLAEIQSIDSMILKI
jgi:hypothetical protein